MLHVTQVVCCPFPVDEVPLRAGAAHSESLPIQMNDLHATLGEGWVPEPGTYRLRVRYSPRVTPTSSKWAWRGTAVSNEVVVRVAPLSQAELQRRRQQLKDCVAAGCDAVELANFYRIIRDDQVGDLLVELLEDSPFSIWLVEAIVHQSRPSDAERLRTIASTLTDDSIRRIFIDAALRIAH